MRRLLVFVCLLASCLLYAGDDSLKGVYRMYDFAAELADAPAPEGYVPFYISHYGRHGARYINSGDEYEIIDSMLHARELSACGEALLRRFDSVYPSLKGRAGDLSAAGQEQQALLAARMLDRWPSVFRDDAAVYAESSVVPRCILSMACFCRTLGGMGKTVIMDVNSARMPYLKLRPAEPFAFGCMPQQAQAADTVFDRLFDNASAVSAADRLQFVQSLYYFVCHLDSAGIRDDAFEDVFTAEELETFHGFDNAKFHHNWGSPRNVSAARPLLEDIIECAESDIACGDVSVRLRFGHDGTLMALLCLMGINEWGNCTWDCSQIPMAASLRWVFAVNAAGAVIVKIQLNENDLLPWTSWPSLKSSLLSRSE